MAGHQHQDRRHMNMANNVDRRHTVSQNYQHGTDRRHLNNLADRRHISPPLHISICDNSTSILGSPQAENILQRNMMDFPQRRHGRGTVFFFALFLFNYVCLRVYRCLYTVMKEGLYLSFKEFSIFTYFHKSHFYFFYFCFNVKDKYHQIN